MTRNYFIIAGLTLLIAVVVFFLQSGSQERILEDTLVENDVYAISFNYWSGQDGYELIASGTSDNFLQSYILVEKSLLAEFQSSGEATAPPTIGVFIFELPERESEDENIGRITRLQNWAQSNPGLTSFENIYGTPEIIEIDGVKALEYTTDGVYQQTIFLASYRGFIYMFVGQYDRPTDNIKADFETLMQTIRFD
jgi:hypothetical protein